MLASARESELVRSLSLVPRASYLDPDFREAMLQADEEHDVTPVLFNHNMFSKARRDKRRIVLPEGADIRVVTAAAELVGRGLCEVTLCGDPAVVAQLAAKAHVDVSGVEIVHPRRVLYEQPEPWADEMVTAFYEARKHKELKDGGLELARKRLAKDPAYFGTMMMYQGMADGMVRDGSSRAAAAARARARVRPRSPRASARARPPLR